MFSSKILRYCTYKLIWMTIVFSTSEKTLIPHVACFVPILPVQWLKQIDSTEAALTQKMIDLENDKVKCPFTLSEQHL